MRISAAVLIAAALLGTALARPRAAAAAAKPQDSLIYMPYGLIHFMRPAAQVDEYLAQVDSYQIGQLIFAMPRFSKRGGLKMPRHNTEMLKLWSERAAAYDAEHASSLGITAVFNGRIKTNRQGLDLDKPATRANIVAAVEASLPTGISGVQLDLEPYPTSAGFLTLLEELDAAFARVGFHGRFSVASPASPWRWTASYLNAVAQHLTQVDPLFYDSEYASASEYQQWVQEGLAYYTENVPAATRIVPVLPSYSANPWHAPSVENIFTATEAVSGALASGSRVNGAGIWWGYGFLMDEEGHYDGGADRAAWQWSTVKLPFSP